MHIIYAYTSISRLCVNVAGTNFFPFMHPCCAVQCFFHTAVFLLCVCLPVSLQLSAVLSEGRPQVPGVPRGVVAHSSGSRNHDAFCRDREIERRLE